MKKLILLFSILINSCSTRGQAIDFEDTIIFIVDRNAKCVTYKDGKVKGDFDIEIKCNYYKETENIYDDKYAEIYFSFEKNDKTVEGEVIFINRKDLDKFKVVDAEWIAKQESRKAIYERISWDWWRKTNIVILKKDLLSGEKEIKAYIVACGEGDVEW